MTPEEFENFCDENPPEKAAQLLRDYVVAGQPDSFLSNYTSRAMCALAAGKYKGKYGGNFDYMDFYHSMWGNVIDLGTPDERRLRHTRCGIALDDGELVS